MLHETTDLPDAIFTHTVAIHAVSEQGLLLWERLCGGGQRLSAIKLVYLPQMRRQHYTRCLVTDAGNITRATLYKDTVRESTKHNELAVAAISRAPSFRGTLGRNEYET